MGYLYSVLTGLAPLFMWPLYVGGHLWSLLTGLVAGLLMFFKAQLLYIASINRHLWLGLMGRYRRPSFIKPMMLAHSPYQLTATRGALLLQLREEGHDDVDVETHYVESDDSNQDDGSKKHDE